VCLKLVCSGVTTGKVNLSVVSMLYYIVLLSVVEELNIMIMITFKMLMSSDRIQIIIIIIIIIIDIII